MEGLRYIRVLIEMKGKEVDVATLLATIKGQPRLPASNGIEVVDDQALQECGAQLQALRQERDQAKRMNQPNEQERIQGEIDVLVACLTPVTGRGGRIRKVKSDTAKIASLIKNNLNRTICHIEAQHPELAAHFRTCIQTGSVIRYAPHPDVVWDL